MDLIEALRCFTRIVEIGSFSAVARESGSSASAVNRQIAQLEAHLGIRLFHRTTRRLSLTDDGQELLGHARHLTEMADEITASMSRQQKSPTGLVRVATPVGTARLLVPRLRSFLERHPGLSVELLVSDRVENLIEARLDLAIRAGTVNDASLVVRSIGTVASLAVAAPSYLERHGAPSTPADLVRHACVIHDLGPESTDWTLDGPGGPERVQVSGALIANSTEVVRQAALEGYGIALLPETHVADDIRSVRLYRVLPEHSTARRPIFIVYPSHRHLAPRTRAVLDFLIEQFRLMQIRLAEERIWGENDDAWLV